MYLKQLESCLSNVCIASCGYVPSQFAFSFQCLIQNDFISIDLLLLKNILIFPVANKIFLIIVNSSHFQENDIFLNYICGCIFFFLLFYCI